MVPWLSWVLLGAGASATPSKGDRAAGGVVVCAAVSSPTGVFKIPPGLSCVLSTLLPRITMPDTAACRSSGLKLCLSASGRTVGGSIAALTEAAAETPGAAAAAVGGLSLLRNSVPSALPLSTGQPRSNVGVAAPAGGSDALRVLRLHQLWLLLFLVVASAWLLRRHNGRINKFKSRIRSCAA